MFNLSEKEYEKRLAILQEKNVQKERIQNLKAEAKKYKKQIKLPSTSKLVLLVVFLMCIEVLLFCEYAMIFLGDTESMYALIGVPAALVPVCLGYFNKSKQENTVNGIVYETAMEKLRQGKETSDDNSVG